MPPLPRSAIFYKTKEQPARHHYYSASSGESRANDEGMSNTKESEAVLSKGQRASARSLLRSTCRLYSSSSNSGSSSGKCDKTATKADRVPNRTALVATVLV
jgi:hypothetical protein